MYVRNEDAVAAPFFALRERRFFGRPLAEANRRFSHALRHLAGWQRSFFPLAGRCFFLCARRNPTSLSPIIRNLERQARVLGLHGPAET